ncbi:MAG: hypothetical protein QXP91_12030 [Candidatus Methanomethylicia archaeon]
MELGVWKQILNALISKGYSISRLSLDRVAVAALPLGLGES